MSKYQQFKKAIAAALDDDKNTKVDKAVDAVIISLIVISTIEIFLSTFTGINEKIGGILNFIDVFTTVVFTIEVTLRISLEGREKEGLRRHSAGCGKYYLLVLRV